MSNAVSLKTEKSEKPSKPHKARVLLCFTAIVCFIVSQLPVDLRFNRQHGKYFSMLSLQCDSDCTDAGSFTSSACKWHFYVNLDTCRMYIYENNRLVGYLFVSGGKPASPAPCGRYRGSVSSVGNENSTVFNIHTPWQIYHIYKVSDTRYSGMIAGAVNFSEGDLYLSDNDFLSLCRIIRSDVPPNDSIAFTISIKCDSYDETLYFPEIRNGMRGHRVYAAQHALRKLGYYAARPDGIFDKATESAVKNFQKDTCLFATGVINLSTYNKLLSVCHFDELL